MSADVLPDYLKPGLRAVFVGTAVGTMCGRRGHYYAGRGNAFWELLYNAWLDNYPLYPEDDRRILDYGFGLTDLVKGVAASSDRGLEYDVRGFIAKMKRYQPAWTVFHGQEAAKQVSKYLRQSIPARPQTRRTKKPRPG